MLTLNEALLNAAAEVSEPTALLAHATRFCERMGFESFAISGIKDLPDGTIRAMSLAKTYSLPASVQDGA